MPDNVERAQSLLLLVVRRWRRCGIEDQDSLDMALRACEREPARAIAAYGAILRSLPPFRSVRIWGVR